MTKLEELEARLAEVRRTIELGWAARGRELRAAVGRLAGGDAGARDELRRLAHRLRGVLEAGDVALAEQAERVERGAETDAALATAALLLAGMLERPRDAAPSEEPREPPASVLGDAPVVGATLGGRVVALDDDDATRRLLTIALTRVGACEAHVMSDAARAMERIRAGGVDLVIVDAMMPDVTGLELYHALRRELGPTLPIAFLSAASAEELGWEVPDDPRVVWLRKPFRPSRLIEQLAAFVRGAR